MSFYCFVSVDGAVGQEPRRAAPQDFLPAANQGLGGPTSQHVWRDCALLPGVSLQHLHTGKHGTAHGSQLGVMRCVSMHHPFIFITFTPHSTPN